MDALRELLLRLEANRIREVILATNPNVEGDATAIYLEDYRPKISRLRLALSYAKVIVLPGFLLERLLGPARTTA